MSFAYHPQTDGQSKAVNQCVEMYQRCFIFDNPRIWYQYLGWAEYWYNTAVHASTGMTPFQVVYGREPPTLIRYAPTLDDAADIRAQLTQRDALLDRLKQHMHRAQACMKKFANRHRHEDEYQEADLVFVKLQPYCQHSVQLRRNRKLGLKFFGPFPIIARIGKVAYCLQLLPTARIHDVFHISQLKRCHGDPTHQYLPLPLLTHDSGPLISPIKILDSRTIMVGEDRKTHVLVEWDGCIVPSWELLTEF